ncbi:hypothetical protein HMN09_00358200 [Mycena chlorophos]|uniref:Uncharacterized protein n=1 Tax=Mycena chlorophos TaxID=658473 RepID=A0A8H6TMP3_MYCCL|nr:hypothetical protein HMN09_00358200 [Mycena chlorophos]
MSNCIAVTYVSLTGGVRVETKNNQTGHSVFHILYNSALKTDEGQFIPARVRVYAGPTDSALVDNTIAFIVAKAYAPSGASSVVELDTILIFPVPGDVNSATYDDQLIDAPSLIFATGHVPSEAQAGVPGFKTFTLAMAEYVGGSMKQFMLQFIFPLTARWRNTPTPRPLNCTHVFGAVRGRSPEGLLRISVDHITFNLTPHTFQTTQTTDNPSAPGSATTSPAKPRKYMAATPGAAGPPPLPTQPVASTSALPSTPTTGAKLSKGKGVAGSKRKRAPSPLTESEEEEDIEEVEEEEPLGKGKRAKKAARRD